MAAADDAARWVRERYERYATEEALTTGRAPQLTDEKTRAPAGPAAMVLEGVFRRFAAGEVSGCLPAVTALTAGLARAPGPRPAALVWLSWHPGLIMCPPCAEMLPDPLGGTGSPLRRVRVCPRTRRADHGHHVCRGGRRQAGGKRGASRPAANRLVRPVPAVQPGQQQGPQPRSGLKRRRGSQSPPVVSRCAACGSGYRRCSVRSLSRSARRSARR